MSDVRPAGLVGPDALVVDDGAGRSPESYPDPDKAEAPDSLTVGRVEVRG